MTRSAPIVLALLALAGPAWSEQFPWKLVAKPKPRMANFGDIKMTNFAGGENMAVLFGGAFVSDAQVRAWAEGMMFWAKPKLTDFADVSLFAVPGPADSTFRKNEFQLDVLARAIADEARLRNPKLIIFAGHSSGAAVAEATLAALEKVAPDLISRIVYYRLDGAGGLSAKLFAKLAGGFCVAAKCARVSSHNGGACGGKFKKITLSLPSADCTSDWCCHVALINTKPKTRGSGDPKDYARFDKDSLPNGGWLAQTSALLKSKSGYGP